MRLTEKEALLVFSALYDQANEKVARARLIESTGRSVFFNVVKHLDQEAETLRELASKISKAQEADDNEVPA